MQFVDESKMDYDELTLNPVLAEIEAETAPDADQRNKQRRYWSTKEEQRFFEIWGRDNWCLKRHGKNTVYFAKWAAELKKCHGIDVKPEEIQTKVNQTRAKFRQVKKQIANNKSGARWKKFDLIDKILKNQYRPKDAEPVPKEAMENNRDIDSDEMNASLSPRQETPNSITSNSATKEAETPKAIESVVQQNSSSAVEENMQVNNEDEILAEHNIPNTLFATSTELFSDGMPEIKSEFQNEYDNFAFQQQSQNQYDPPVAREEEEEEPQLHQLQTPQQQLEQQQMQQQQYQQYRPTPSTSAPPPDTNLASLHPEHHLQPPVQQQHAVGYDHTNNAYVVNHAGGAPGNQNHYPNYNHQYDATNTYNNGTNTVNAMQPPAAKPARVRQPRRRRPAARASDTNNMVVPAGAPGVDSIERLYLEEVRKKNSILAEQREIAFKRLQLDQRKVALMEQFFPKCIEMQEQILQKFVRKE